MSISQHGGPVRFFLGTNSAQGFVSFFSQLAGPEPDWHTYIIKGGPGCGKSTFLRRVAAQYAPQDPDAQLICCSSDRDSLDAVILPRFHVSLADGTAPHVLEADFPALRQTLLPLGDGLDPEALAPSGPAILALSAQSSQAYRQVTSCLAAAAAFLEDGRRLALARADLPKLRAAARRFAHTHLGAAARPGHPAREQVRLLSSISCDGQTFLADTVQQLCPRVWFFEDESGALADQFLQELRQAALEMGLDVITCPCALCPEHTDHLLIPQAGLAVLTENRFHPLQPLTPQRRIHARRFLPEGALAAHKKALSFQRRAAASLLEQACRTLGQIRENHDQLEVLYRQAMDFSPVEAQLERVCRRLVLPS